MSELIDLINGIIKYDNKTIIIVIDEDQIIWFYAKQITKILEYKKTRNVIHQLSPKFKTTYDIIKKYSKIQHNIQDHTIFINESGDYDLAIKSRMKKAVVFRDWLTQTVVPTIRKMGKYELNEEHKKRNELLTQELDEYKKRVKILENNQKRERYP
jgi:prophage antirepressor-like protein